MQPVFNYFDLGLKELEVFVQFGSTIFERIGNKFYLRANGEHFELTTDEAIDLQGEINKEANSPLDAAVICIESTHKYNKISK